ncbi:MAG TPA: hypothetical protein VNE40_02250 [Candidatus Dormibacteraeota bacterium]|nr:hypothetical protein [Candidatus Dormibacteraeota bacterium]
MPVNRRSLSPVDPNVAINTFDCDFGKIPTKTITLEEYRALGGMSLNVSSKKPSPEIDAELLKSSEETPEDRQPVAE